MQVPSYISRSVAGSYDNEAVAIFALIFTFYLYVKVCLENFILYLEISMQYLLDNENKFLLYFLFVISLMPVMLIAFCDGGEVILFIMRFTRKYQWGIASFGALGL